MAVAVAQETLKRTGKKAPHPKINRSDINTVRKGGTKKGFLRNRAELIGQVPGREDEIPAPISAVDHKPTWRRDLADFRN
ncbi:hypothetical protein E2C01_059198 [Portunus trituberculatus]|uniref:Uncharacterized protein n=1 Tax=Portunus trituberculatus TaxID=210409 RepID=A0A5B7H4Q0_PORTR|nr:hypothetical protein [Portunus trituberculatus]